MNLRLRFPWVTQGFITIGGIIILVVMVVALFGPLVIPRERAERMALSNVFRPPFWMNGGQWKNPLGTDHMGRDVFAQLIYGARISISIGVSSVLIAGLFGVLLGLTSGFFGRWIDTVIMRLVDLQLSFPPVLLAIVVIAIMGKGIFNLIMVLGIVSWVQYARVVRTVTLSLKEKEFVEAARAAGTRQVAIVLKHILPNLISPVIVIAAVNVSNMILAEAALSFLGLGVQPPTPSWGSMLFQGKEYFFRAWWMAVFPGIVIATMVFGINLFGDGLRDFLNPRRRETK